MSFELVQPSSHHGDLAASQTTASIQDIEPIVRQTVQPAAASEQAVAAKWDTVSDSGDFFDQVRAGFTNAGDAVVGVFATPFRAVADAIGVSSPEGSVLKDPFSAERLDVPIPSNATAALNMQASSTHSDDPFAENGPSRPGDGSASGEETFDGERTDEDDDLASGISARLREVVGDPRSESRHEDYAEAPTKAAAVPVPQRNARFVPEENAYHDDGFIDDRWQMGGADDSGYRPAGSFGDYVDDPTMNRAGQLQREAEEDAVAAEVTLATKLRTRAQGAAPTKSRGWRFWRKKGNDRSTVPPIIVGTTHGALTDRIALGTGTSDGGSFFAGPGGGFVGEVAGLSSQSAAAVPAFAETPHVPPRPPKPPGRFEQLKGPRKIMMRRARNLQWLVWWTLALVTFATVAALFGILYAVLVDDHVSTRPVYPPAYTSDGSYYPQFGPQPPPPPTPDDVPGAPPMILAELPAASPATVARVLPAVRTPAMAADIPPDFVPEVVPRIVRMLGEDQIPTVSAKQVPVLSHGQIPAVTTAKLVLAMTPLQQEVFMGGRQGVDFLLAQVAVAPVPLAPLRDTYRTAFGPPHAPPLVDQWRGTSVLQPFLDMARIAPATLRADKTTTTPIPTEIPPPVPAPVRPPHGAYCPSNLRTFLLWQGVVMAGNAGLLLGMVSVIVCVPLTVTTGRILFAVAAVMCFGWFIFGFVWTFIGSIYIWTIVFNKQHREGCRNITWAVFVEILFAYIFYISIVIFLIVAATKLAKVGASHAEERFGVDDKAGRCKAAMSRFFQSIKRGICRCMACLPCPASLTDRFENWAE